MAKNYEYKKATIADIDELVRTIILVLTSSSMSAMVAFLYS